MALVKWDAWREMEDMFDRYFKHAGLPLAGGQETMTSGEWSPRVDISETDAEFEIKAEIPEVSKEDIHVSVNNGVMTLRGERKQEKEDKNKKYHRIERRYGSFSRSFTLPENVDPAGVKAAFKDGLLAIRIPKSAKSQPKAIEVKVD